ncbi:MAG: LolA-related protein [Dongiaceae bacterium]
MSRLAIFFTLSIFAFATFAQADDLKVGQALTPGQVLRGQFIQLRSLEGFQAPLKSEGHFVVAAGRGLIWIVEKPFPTTTVITPAGLVQEARGNETLRLAASRIPFMSRLYDMLSGTMSGDWSQLKKDFTVASSGSEKNWQLRLTPAKSDNKAALPIQEMDVQGDSFVNSVDIRRPNGDRDQLQFHDQSVDTQPLSAEEAKLLDNANKQ